MSVKDTVSSLPRRVRTANYLLGRRIQSIRNLSDSWRKHRGSKRTENRHDGNHAHIRELLTVLPLPRIALVASFELDQLTTIPTLERVQLALAP